MWSEMGSGVPPRIQFDGVGVDTPALFMKLAVNRKFLSVFPSANGPFAAHKIGRNFLPGIQPDAGLLPTRSHFRGVRSRMAVYRHIPPHRAARIIPVKTCHSPNVRFCPLPEIGHRHKERFRGFGSRIHTASRKTIRNLCGCRKPRHSASRNDVPDVIHKGPAWPGPRSLT